MSTPPDSQPLAGPPASSLPGKLREALRRTASICLILGGIFILLNLDALLGGHPDLPMADGSLSYALLFVAGLFTGFHCVGMCGALVVGYTVRAAAGSGSKYVTHLYYGLGKTLSYTVVGGLFGALGAIVTFTPFMRGVAGVAAGVFLLLFGLATLNLFPSLSRFRIKMPGFVMRRLGQAYRQNSNPFVIGLLNGLMIICGPLQAMYIMAAGTGDPLEGAKLLFVFGLGTLPVMLGFGLLTSALSRQFAPKIVKASGVVVIGLGALMLNRGLAMTGSGYDYQSLAARWTGAPLPVAAPQPDVQVIHMKVGREGFEPKQFTLRKGVPVRWVIEGESLDYCNHRIVVPSLGLEFDVQPGENLIEFTPGQAGIMPWSCWMGMQQGTFLVHEDPRSVPQPFNPLSALHDHGGGHAMTPAPAGHEAHQGHGGNEGHEGHMAHEGHEAQAEPQGHDGHGGAASQKPEWMRGLLERSASAIEALRRSLKP
jgi:sulfite exporter TauE/SafE